jgi:hypothetical protein
MVETVAHLAIVMMESYAAYEEAVKAWERVCSGKVQGRPNPKLQWR